jgi:hypothetical protein
MESREGSEYYRQAQIDLEIRFGEGAMSSHISAFKNSLKEKENFFKNASQGVRNMAMDQLQKERLHVALLMSTITPVKDGKLQLSSEQTHLFCYEAIKFMNSDFDLGFHEEQFIDDDIAEIEDDDDADEEDELEETAEQMKILSRLTLLKFVLANMKLHLNRYARSTSMEDDKKRSIRIDIASGKLNDTILDLFSATFKCKVTIFSDFQDTIIYTSNPNLFKIIKNDDSTVEDIKEFGYSLQEHMAISV